MTVCFYFHRQDFFESFLSIIKELSKRNTIFIIVSFEVDYKKKIFFNKKNVFIYDFKYLINKKIINFLNFLKIFSKKRNFFQIFISFLYNYFKIKSEIKFIDSGKSCADSDAMLEATEYEKGDIP